MGSRFPSHQLSNGLYVSGRPDQPKEKPVTVSCTPMPYTGGDIKKSGELGKMLEVHVENSKSRKSGPIMPNSTVRSSHSSSPVPSPAAPGPASLLVTGRSSRHKSNSGPMNRHADSVKKSSGLQSGGVTRQSSGPLPPTGLITSGPISSGPLNSSGTQRKLSGPLDSSGSTKFRSSSIAHNQAITKLNDEKDYSFKMSFPKAITCCWGRRAVVGFVARYPDAELRTAKNGQYVKVTGVVTCGNVPLESSYQKVSRCVYTSTSLCEYRGWNSKSANSQHRRFTWGVRLVERHVVDFYISDFQSGLRALVKTGYGARVTPYVDESVIVNVNPGNKDLSLQFLSWLRERNLSSDDRVMRLKEGYIKEGSTVSIMGIVQRNDNVLMIVPPSQPISTGCQWATCILPASLEGIVLRCEDNSGIDIVPV